MLLPQLQHVREALEVRLFLTIEQSTSSTGPGGVMMSLAGCRPLLDAHVCSPEEAISEQRPAEPCVPCVWGKTTYPRLPTSQWSLLGVAEMAPSTVVVLEAVRVGKAAPSSSPIAASTKTFYRRHRTAWRVFGDPAPALALSANHTPPEVSENHGGSPVHICSASFYHPAGLDSSPSILPSPFANPRLVKIADSQSHTDTIYVKSNDWFFASSGY